jgi:potassium efflux system protein
MPVNEEVVHWFNNKITLGTLTLPFTWQALLLTWVLPLTITLLLVILVPVIVRRALTRAEIQEEGRQKVLVPLNMILRTLGVLTMTVFTIALFGDNIWEALNAIAEPFQTPFYESGNTKISLSTLILVIPILYLASWLGGASKKITDRYLFSQMKLSESKKFGVASLVRYGVIVLTMLVGLPMVGIDLSSLLVLFSVLGIGLGFGLQTTVSNFFAGLVMIFSQPVKEGDFISLEHHMGTVQKVNLLSTILLTPTNETLIVPNSFIVNNVIHNHTFENRWIIQKVPVAVHYNSDITKVKEILLQIGRDSPYNYPKKEPEVRFLLLADSGLNYELLLTLKDVKDKFQSLTWANEQIIERFREAGIAIPYPQMDVHLDKG